MVKVVDETETSQKKLDRTRKLESLARDCFEGREEFYFCANSIGDAFSIGKDKQVFFYGPDRMEVKDKDYLDQAMKFAEAYEKEFGGEVTIKTNYAK